MHFSHSAWISLLNLDFLTLLILLCSVCTSPLHLHFLSTFFYLVHTSALFFLQNILLYILCISYFSASKIRSRNRNDVAYKLKPSPFMLSFFLQFPHFILSPTLLTLHFIGIFYFLKDIEHLWTSLNILPTSLCSALLHTLSLTILLCISILLHFILLYTLPLYHNYSASYLCIASLYSLSHFIFSTNLFYYSYLHIALLHFIRKITMLLEYTQLPWNIKCQGI